MAKKIQYDEFLAKAKKVWGDKFIYPTPDNFDYRKGTIEIICPSHGPFRRVPTNHVASNKHRKPAGCPECFREADRKAKMKPFSTFVEDARKIHGKKYDYIESTYDGAKQNMEIICTKHGIFLQTPDGHINGKAGCVFCANEATTIRNVTLGLKNAQKKLKEITSGKVKIVEDSYEAQREEAQFVCKEHGEFSRIVILALTSVFPCKECGEGKADTNILTKQQIYQKISAMKGNFKIIEIFGEGKDADIKVECFDCDRGEYTTSVNNSYRYDVLCGNCRRIASEPFRKAMVKKSIDESLEIRKEYYLKRFYENWGDKYDYTEVDFQSGSKPIKVICREPNHPPWYTKPDAHLKKGCRFCANEQLGGKYSSKFFELFPEERASEGKLYYLKIRYNDTVFYKVGITKNDVHIRHAMLNSIDGLEWKIVREKTTSLFTAFTAEQGIQREHGDNFRRELPLGKELVRKCRIGPSECFFERMPHATFTKYFD